MWVRLVQGTYAIVSYGSVERYANYAHEGMHRRNKRNARSCNSFRYGHNSYAQQQMQCNLRLEEHALSEGLSDEATPAQRRRVLHNWATRNLTLCPELHKYLPNGKPMFSKE